jgi:hypothetical protein
MTKQEAIISVLGLLVINVVARILPHVPNFAPVTATGLFCGAYMGRRVSLPVTLLVLLLSDYALLYVNPYGQIHLGTVYAPWRLWYGDTQLFVYASFAISALAGQWLRTRRTATELVVVALFCSLQFFLITNAAVWLNGAYDRGISGLYQAWVAGIPFFKGTVAGDLLYTTAFFGLYELVKAQRRQPAVQT